MSDWRPTATLEHLRLRAAALAAARGFFAQRDVLEVEAPLLVRRPVSDPHLANIRCTLGVRPGEDVYLHTSPEYAMKRLLAAGAPDIFYLGKVFRDDEAGPRHLPEFTLIEWYRREMAYETFIAECLDLIGTLALCFGKRLPPARRFSYRELFSNLAGFDPVSASLTRIRTCARERLGDALDATVERSLGDDRNGWLDLLLVSLIEPSLRDAGLVVIDRYPADQAALARLDPTDPRVAERFEIYLDGIELANGYHELADAGEQARRFEADRTRRRELGRPDTVPDEALLAALDAGLPDCCGVAVGFDRLMMACLGVSRIEQTVGFLPPG